MGMKPRLSRNDLNAPKPKVQHFTPECPHVKWVPDGVRTGKKRISRAHGIAHSDYPDMVNCTYCQRLPGWKKALKVKQAREVARYREAIKQFQGFLDFWRGLKI